MTTQETCNAIISGIRDYFRKNSFKSAVIGLSGGVDSSVACRLAARALGSKNVTALLMPEKGVTSKESIKDAKNLAEKLGINRHILPINDASDIIKKISAQSGNFFAKVVKDIYAQANLKALTRMLLLYYFANINNSLVIGTSDKSEIALGYTTKYGDNAADILIIGDLWKTEVIEMGKFLGIPPSILGKEPSAELIAGQTAQKELGADYEILDKILKMQIEDSLSVQEIIGKGFDEKIVKNVSRRIRLNEHKRRAAMLIRLSECSFHGMEWRMPVTNGFKE